MKKQAKRARFKTAQQIESELGISAKTILNRSNLKRSDPRHLPSKTLKGGRRKYFESKVITRLLMED